MELGIVILIIVNIAAVAFSYGKLSQKVSDLCKRVGKVEERLNHLGDKVDTLTAEVTGMKRG